MEVNKDLLCGNVASLIEFKNSIVHPIGEINLTLSIGVHLKRASLTTMFMTVDCHSSYNVILRHLFLTKDGHDNQPEDASDEILDPTRVEIVRGVSIGYVLPRRSNDDIVGNTTLIPQLLQLRLGHDTRGMVGPMILSVVVIRVDTDADSICVRKASMPLRPYLGDW